MNPAIKIAIVISIILLAIVTVYYTYGYLVKRNTKRMLYKDFLRYENPKAPLYIIFNAYKYDPYLLLVEDNLYRTKDKEKFLGEIRFLLSAIEQEEDDISKTKHVEEVFKYLGKTVTEGYSKEYHIDTDKYNIIFNGYKLVNMDRWKHFLFENTETGLNFQVRQYELDCLTSNTRLGEVV